MEIKEKDLELYEKENKINRETIQNFPYQYIKQNTAIFFVKFDPEKFNSEMLCDMADLYFRTDLYLQLYELSAHTNIRKVHVYLEVGPLYDEGDLKIFKRFMNHLASTIRFVKEHSRMKVYLHYYKYEHELYKHTDDIITNIANNYRISVMKYKKPDVYTGGNKSYFIVGFLKKNGLRKIHYQECHYNDNTPSDFDYSKVTVMNDNSRIYCIF